MNDVLSSAFLYFIMKKAGMEAESYTLRLIS